MELTTVGGRQQKVQTAFFDTRSVWGQHLIVVGQNMFEVLFHNPQLQPVHCHQKSCRNLTILSFWGLAEYLMHVLSYYFLIRLIDYCGQVENI